MKNAHLKTCNNLIFANIHRWYKLHTIKNVSDAVLRSWNRNLAAILDLLGEPRIWHNERHENHNVKAEVQTRKPFRTQS